MTDVVITLSLARRSGILAAAISALTRAGLDFKTHRFDPSDGAGGHRLDLLAETEAAFGDPRALIDGLSAIRGVDSVVDLVIDGRSLIAPEGDESETRPSVGSPPDGADFGADAEPEPEPTPRAAPATAQQAELVEEVAEQAPDENPGSEPADPADRPDKDMRPSMTRRRRRRR